ncbi:MAG: starvation-inducible outer membrane lipoprotein [Bacteroidia bacterium]|jgi:starvation-inducible outer membrane lipoprotein
MKNTLIILSLFTLAACSSAPTESEETENITETKDDTTTLQDMLNEKKEGFNVKAEPIEVLNALTHTK